MGDNCSEVSQSMYGFRVNAEFRQIVRVAVRMYAIRSPGPERGKRLDGRCLAQSGVSRGQFASD